MQSNIDEIDLFYIAFKSNLLWRNIIEICNKNIIKEKLIYFIDIDTVMLLNIYLIIYITKLSNNYVYFYDNNLEYI